MGIVIRRAVRLRRVRDDLVAWATSGIDDGRVEHVRAQVGNVEDDRVWRCRTFSATVRAAPREGPEYGWRFPIVGRGRVTDAPALHVWIEVC
jgi:hypothetical protein